MPDLAAADLPAAAACGRCAHPSGQSRALRSPLREPVHNRGDLARLPGTEGKLEVVQNLIGEPVIDRAHEGQDLRDPLHPGGVAGPLSIAPRLARGMAELCLGQDPQIGFRALAVHVLSVPSAAARRSRSILNAALSALE